MEKVELRITGKEEQIIRRLSSLGYEAYAVGGCVRDAFLGVPSLDVDIVTNAPYEVMEKELQDIGYIDIVGKQFAVLMCAGIEIAQYRAENYSLDGRGKPTVVAAPSAKEDASRRDFTINALYMDLEGNLLDYYDGFSDLQERLVRAVGNPDERFQEDASRILRAAYLASKLRFTIEGETKASMRRNRQLLENVPHEMMGKIVKKSIEAGNFSYFVRLLEETETLNFVFPELVHLIGLHQNPKYHLFDGWNHTLEVVRAAEKIRPGSVPFLLGALLHDNAKGLVEVRGVNKEGQVNDLNHEEIGAPIAYKTVTRLGLGKDVAREVSMLVKHHGFRIPATCKSLHKQIRKVSEDAAHIDELKVWMDTLLDIMKADALGGFSPALTAESLTLNENLRILIPSVFEKYIYFVSQLPIRGGEVIKYGIIGAEIGLFLNQLVRENMTDVDLIQKRLERTALKK